MCVQRGPLRDLAFDLPIRSIDLDRLDLLQRSRAQHRHDMAAKQLLVALERSPADLSLPAPESVVTPVGVMLMLATGHSTKFAGKLAMVLTLFADTLICVMPGSLPVTVLSLAVPVAAFGAPWTLIPRASR